MRTPKQTKAWSVRNPILEKIQFSFRDSIIRATTPQEKLDNVKYILSWLGKISYHNLDDFGKP
jgi:hypothetical protein